MQVLRTRSARLCRRRPCRQLRDLTRAAKQLGHEVWQHSLRIQ